jgi:hypothetical protein
VPHAYLIHNYDLGTLNSPSARIRACSAVQCAAPSQPAGRLAPHDNECGDHRITPPVCTAPPMPPMRADSPRKQELARRFVLRLSAELYGGGSGSNVTGPRLRGARLAGGTDVVLTFSSSPPSSSWCSGRCVLFDGRFD